MRERRDEAGKAASRRSAEPPSPWQPPTAGQGAGTGLYPAEWIASTQRGVLWRRTISKRFRQRVAPEIGRRQDAAMQGLFSILDRHPELCCCRRDQVVFLAGGQRTIPPKDAGLMLIRDDTDLMALLEGN